MPSCSCGSGTVACWTSDSTGVASAGGNCGSACHRSGTEYPITGSDAVGQETSPLPSRRLHRTASVICNLVECVGYWPAYAACMLWVAFRSIIRPVTCDRRVHYAVCFRPECTRVSAPHLLYGSVSCLARQSFLICQAALPCRLARPHALPVEVDGTEVLPAHE